MPVWTSLYCLRTKEPTELCTHPLFHQCSYSSHSHSWWITLGLKQYSWIRVKTECPLPCIQSPFPLSLYSIFQNRRYSYKLILIIINCLCSVLYSTWIDKNKYFYFFLFLKETVDGIRLPKVCWRFTCLVGFRLNASSHGLSGCFSERPLWNCLGIFKILCCQCWAPNWNIFFFY